MAAIQMNRTHRILIGVVVAGAVVIAAIGFAGSYAAVRDLAERKGFGAFSAVFPIGIDAGIVVLLALDLLLTWIRIPFPLLRQTAWLLTTATIAFNGAAAWPDPLGVGMHAVIPVLFVVAVEAARHAIGRIADITADRHMDSVRIARWLLAFPSTFRLWRRMKLWELRSYQEVIRFEQDRLVYQARLRAHYGRAWRRKAPVESLMPLRLARYGVPLAQTGPAGLTAAGITVSRPLGPAGPVHQPTETVPLHPAGAAPEPVVSAASAAPEQLPQLAAGVPGTVPAAGTQPAPGTVPEPAPVPQPGHAVPVYAAETTHGPQVTVPVGPGRRRSLGQAQSNSHPAFVPPPRAGGPEPSQQLFVEPPPAPEVYPEPEPDPDDEPVGIPDGVPREEVYFEAYRQFIAEQGSRPNARQLSRALHDHFGVTRADGSLLSESYLRVYMREFRDRYDAEMGMAG